MNYLILNRAIFSILITAVLLTFLSFDTKAETIYVPAGSVWSYLDDGSNQTNPWIGVDPGLWHRLDPLL